MVRSAILLLPLVVACAPTVQTATESAPPAPSAPPAAQVGTPAAAATLLGDYTVTLAETDFPATAQQQIRSGSAGTWKISFHQGDHFVATHNGRQVVEGPYQVRGDQLVFPLGQSGPYACNAPATYTWRSSGGQLTFAPVGQDACVGRTLVIATRPLARQP